MGIQVSWMDADDAPRIGEQLRSNTRMVFLETPSNPLCKIVDIEAVRQAADAVGAMVVVDNTFATPYHQKPLKQGAHLVVHKRHQARWEATTTSWPAQLPG